MQTLFDPQEMEEDRRLCYVAITRAKEKLYITNALSRMLYGATARNRPSRFLSDIPPELIEEHRCQRQYARPLSYDTPRRDEKGFASSFASAGSSGQWTASPVRAVAKQKISALQAPPSSAEASCSWQAGDRVFHSAFGEGVIQSVSSMGNDHLLDIQFDKVGRKKLMANFARLKRLDG